MRRIGWSAFLVLALAAGGVACGDDDDEGDGGDTTETETDGGDDTTGEDEGGEDEGGEDEGGEDEGADGDIQAFCDAVDEYVEAVQEADAESAAELSAQGQELSTQAQELIPTLDTEGAEDVAECTADLTSAVPGG